MAFGLRFILIHELDLFSASNLKKPYGKGEYVGVFQCQKCGNFKLHTLECCDCTSCNINGCNGYMNLHVLTTEKAWGIPAIADKLKIFELLR
jgi:hypothetical protein